MGEIELKDIFSLSRGLGKISFSDLVHASCGFKVDPIDSNSQEDKELLNHITSALDNFVKLTKQTGVRFRGQRINDVGKKIEPLISQELRKRPLEVNQLKASGYPDYEIKQGDRTSYLELKITGSMKKKETHYRMFYFSTGKKISSDARHLLIQIQMQEEENKYWKVVSWQLRDLSRLKLNLKTEFNANFPDIDEIPILSSGKLGT